MASQIERQRLSELTDLNLLAKVESMNNIAKQRKFVPTKFIKAPLSAKTQKEVDQVNLENTLLLQNDKIGIESQKKTNTPKVLKQAENKILKDYEDKNPETYEYVDENGITRYRNYQLPELEPELEEEFPPFPKADFEEKVKKLNDELIQDTNDSKDIYESIQELENTIKQVEDDINTGRISLAYGTTQIYNLEDEINFLFNMGRKIEERANDKYLLIQKMREDEQLYEKHADEIKRNNEIKIADYKYQIELLNKKSLSTNKLPNENDVEYLERLKQNAEVEDNETKLYNAKLLVIKKFKELLSEVVRDPVIVSQISNSIDSSLYDDVENRDAVVKSWNIIKNKLQQLYGNNINKLNAGEISSFLTTFLQRGESPNLPVGIEREIRSSTSYKIDSITQIAIEVDDNTAVLYKQDEEGLPRKVYLKIVLLVERGGFNSTYALLYSFTGDKGSYKQYFDGGRSGIPDNRKDPKGRKGKKLKSIEEIEENTGINAKSLNTLFNLDSNVVNPMNICRKLIADYGLVPMPKNEAIEKQTKMVGRDVVEYGYGIDNEKLPKFARFGEIFINIKKLFYQNELSVKNKQLKSFPHFLNAKVSEKFVKIIMNMMENIKPSYEEVNRLSTTERQLYDRLISLAGFHRMMPNKKEHTIDELKQRLHLLEAETNIGNNSPLIKKEIYTILYYLKDLGVITPTQIKNYYKQYK